MGFILHWPFPYNNRLCKLHQSCYCAGIEPFKRNRYPQKYWAVCADNCFGNLLLKTALITIVATLLACGIATLVLPLLNGLLKSEMSLNFSNWQLPVFLLLLSAIVTFLSGSYPGLILARFQPVLALKSKLSQKHIGGFSLRRVLVVTQFAISQVLIIGTIVIASQMHYSKTTDLGFNKESIVLLPLPISDKVKMNTLKTRLSGISGVERFPFVSRRLQRIQTAIQMSVMITGRKMNIGELI